MISNEQILNFIEEARIKAQIIVTPEELNKKIAQGGNRNFIKVGTIDKPKSKDGYFSVMQNTYCLTIHYGNWAIGVKFNHTIKINNNEPIRKYTTKERNEYRIEQEKRKQIAEASLLRDKELKSIKYRYRFNTFYDIGYQQSHPYFEKKKLSELTYLYKYDFKLDGYNNLCIPTYDINREIQGYQRITIDGDKNFRGNLAKGFWEYPKQNKIPQIDSLNIWWVFAEGVATTLTVYELLAEDCYYRRHKNMFFIALVGFTVHGLMDVAKVIQDSNYRAIYVIDNDDGKSKNSGIEMARKIIATFSDVDFIPIIFSDSQNKPTDANDFFVANGYELTKKELTRQLNDGLIKYGL